MKDSRALTAVMAVVAVAATCLALFALLRPAEPTIARGPSTGPDAACDCDCERDAGEATGSTSTSAMEPQLLRYAVCPSGEAPPQWATVTLWREPRLAIHCGTSIHVVGFDQVAGDARPRRLARIDAPALDPGTAAVAVAPVAGDVDGDGEADLIVPVVSREASGAVRAGALYLLPADHAGGFAPARRVVETAPASLALGQQDGHGGLELAVLHAPGAGRSSELWVLSSGPSPMRTSQTPLGQGSGWVAWLDTNGDGRDEPLAALQGAVGVHGPSLSAHDDGGVGPLSQLSVGRSGRTIQLGADGGTALLMLGDGAWIVPGGANATARQVEGSTGLVEIGAFDIDGDGHIDLFGHDSAGAVLLIAGPDGGFKRGDAVALAGEGLTPLSFTVAHADSDPRGDGLVLGVSAGPEPQVELGVVTDIADATRVQVSATVRALEDAPLSLHIALP